MCIFTEVLYCALNDRVCLGLILSSPFGPSSFLLLLIVLHWTDGADSFTLSTLVIRLTLFDSPSLSELLLLVKYFDVRIGTDVNADATWVWVLVLILLLYKLLPVLLSAIVDAAANDSMPRPFVTLFLLSNLLYRLRTTMANCVRLAYYRR